MAREWTGEQLSAIEARGASVVVDAAAGSGKTSVLVERIIRLLTDEQNGCKAEELVVVTFTTDAAAEVRTRLNLALTAELLANPDNTWLRRQQTMLQSAKISTIHSFCFNLLRENFAAAGLPAGFRVMDETEEKELRTAAAEQVLEEYSAAPEDSDTGRELQLLVDAFCTGDDTALIPLMLGLYELLDSMPFGEKMLAQAARAYGTDGMRRKICGLLQERAGEITAIYDRALALIRPIATPKALAVIAGEKDYADRLKAACDAGDFAVLSEMLGGYRFDRFTPPRKNGGAAVGALRKHGKALIENLQKWAVALSYADSDMQRHAAILAAFSRMLGVFSARLAEKKIDRGAIGFGDAMTMTLRLLAVQNEDGTVTKTPLAGELSERYAYIMIDEFQDADNQQDLIFRMLSKGGSAEKYGSNLFVVGDSKQCIYRFRNANPNNFRGAMEAAVPYVSVQCKENTCIHLNRNFRSAEEVIGLVNGIFSRLMTREVGEISYDSTQELVQGARYFTELDGKAFLRQPEMILLPNSKEDPADEPGAVAGRIREMLDMGIPVQDARTEGGVRPCAPRDFLILMRTSTHMQDFADALNEAGVPVCSLEQTGYLKSPEIVLLLNILRAVDNPLLDVPLAAAMLSPMFGFTAEELVQVRLYDRTNFLFPAMCALREDAEQPESLRTKCAELLDFLEDMRLYAAMDTPAELVRRIYGETDFLGMMQLTDESGQRKANLRALITHAQGCEESRGGGLSGFLRYIDAVMSRGDDLSGGEVPAGSEDVVQIKTIHKSKGLEAPFVVLANSKNPFSSEDAKSVFQYHTEYGIGFKLRDAEERTFGASLPFLAVLSENMRESVSEELRLLYVALTRAKERLILPVVYSEDYRKRALEFAAEQEAFGGQNDSLTRSAHSMRDWLMMSLLRSKGGAALRSAFEADFDADPGTRIISLAVRTEYPGDRAENPSAHTEPEADSGLVALLEKQCAWEYDSKYAALTAKYGVSELTEEAYGASLKRPAFVVRRNGLSGAERGTALHTFLQFTSFAAAEKDLPGEIDRLEKEGRLNERQAEAVRRSKIAMFFASPLYARVKAAKRVWRERQFNVHIADLTLTGELAKYHDEYAGTEGMLTGAMDLIFEEEGGIVLVDYKTDAMHEDAEFLEKYAMQVQLYAAALNLLMQKPVRECRLYSLYLNREISVPL